MNATPHTQDSEPERRLLPPPSNPMAVAHELLNEERHAQLGVLLRLYWRGSWRRWFDGGWHEEEERAVRADVYRRLEHAQYVHSSRDGEELRDWSPNRRKMADVLEAMEAVAHLPSHIQPPVWIGGASGPRHLVVLGNGILDVTNRHLQQHDPRWFSTVVVPFDYDERAPSPTRWLEFLRRLWHDSEAIAALQEFFGYVISGRTDLDKILLLIGPTRAGKGVITRVLGKLIGPASVAGPTLAGLGQNFGLQDLIGKPLAVVSDARLGRADTHQVVERLLAISGRDMLTIDRKYREPWTGQLPTRFVVVSNELPRFGDASGAIAHRFVVLTLTESWLGREDRALEEELTAELPSILNWALEGLARLQGNGRFTEPRSSLDAIVALEDLVSPVAAFVRDRCDKGAHEVPCAALYAEWKSWAEDNGHRAGSAQSFAKDLRAVIPSLRVVRPREGEGRERRYQGIRVKSLSQWLDPRTTADQARGPHWSASQPDVVPAEIAV